MLRCALSHWAMPNIVPKDDRTVETCHYNNMKNCIVLTGINKYILSDYRKVATTVH
jgi:hypothetical protein